MPPRVVRLADRLGLEGEQRRRFVRLQGRFFVETMRQLASFPSDESLWILSERGTRYVALHLDLYGSEHIPGLLDRLERHSLQLRPLVRNGSLLIFELIP